MNKFIDKVPVRVRLFFAFTAFAWASLFKPNEGLSFIEHAQLGLRNRTVDEIEKSRDTLRQVLKD